MTYEELISNTENGDVIVDSEINNNTFVRVDDKFYDEDLNEMVNIDAEWIVIGSLKKKGIKKLAKQIAEKANTKLIEEQQNKKDEKMRVKMKDKQMKKKDLKKANIVLGEAISEMESIIAEMAIENMSNKFTIEMAEGHLNIAESEIDRLNIIVNYLETKGMK